MEKIPSLLPKEMTSQVDTVLSARMVQCLGKQASGIVRGVRTEQKKRLSKIKWLREQGYNSAADKVQKKYDEQKVSKPNIKTFEPQLDDRLAMINWENNTMFDGWVTLKCIYKPGSGPKLQEDRKIVIPFKKTDHINKMFRKGKVMNSIRLSNKMITFQFEFEAPENNNTGKIAIDVGVNSAISVDYGDHRYQSGKDIHGHDLKSITEKLCRKRKGSKGFRKAKAHQENYINAELNKIEWDGIGFARHEKLHRMRDGVNVGRYLSHFVYRYIFDRYELDAEEHNVCVSEIEPTYTSQRCSVCGWTHAKNRKKELFKCTACGFKDNADLNASTNIWQDLVPLGDEAWRSKKSKIGFYWSKIGEEPIVPRVEETDGLISVISRDVIKV